MLRKRDRLFKRARRVNNPVSWAAFKTHRNKVSKLIRHSYHTYVNEVIGNSLSENPKRFWSYVKASNTENIGIPTLIEEDTLHCNNSSKANALNSHFQAQFTEDDKQIPPMPNSPFPDIPKIQISTAGVASRLKKLQPNKACGPDELPPTIYRDYADELAPMLAFIFQQTYDNGTIPDDWKGALVSAIHKKGSTSSPSNYRPISLTCIACKVMEHIVLSNINKHLEHLNIINEQGSICETR